LEYECKVMVGKCRDALENQHAARGNNGVTADKKAQSTSRAWEEKRVARYGRQPLEVDESFRRQLTQTP